MVTLSFTIFSGQKNYNRAHMLFQVLCGFEPIFYTTHPNEEPKIKHKIQYDYIYVTPELQFKNKLCVLVLNTKYITIENKNFADELEYLFRFNQDILAEIRKKSGDILTRIGINSL